MHFCCQLLALCPASYNSNICVQIIAMLGSCTSTLYGFTSLARGQDHYLVIGPSILLLWWSSREEWNMSPFLWLQFYGCLLWQYVNSLYWRMHVDQGCGDNSVCVGCLCNMNDVQAQSRWALAVAGCKPDVNIISILRLCIWMGVEGETFQFGEVIGEDNFVGIIWDCVVFVHKDGMCTWR